MEPEEHPLLELVQNLVLVQQSETLVALQSVVGFDSVVFASEVEKLSVAAAPFAVGSFYCHAVADSQTQMRFALGHHHNPSFSERMMSLGVV